MNMHLETEDDWRDFFAQAKIKLENCSKYAKIFVEKEITDYILPEITKDFLNEISITNVVDQMAISRLCKQYGHATDPTNIVGYGLSQQEYVQNAQQLPNVFTTELGIYTCIIVTLLK